MLHVLLLLLDKWRVLKNSLRMSLKLGKTHFFFWGGGGICDFKLCVQPFIFLILYNFLGNQNFELPLNFISCLVICIFGTLMLARPTLV